jgi:CRP-like cAMP-binding protein
MDSAGLKPSVSLQFPEPRPICSKATRNLRPINDGLYVTGAKIKAHHPVLHTRLSECVLDCELVDAIEALSKLRQVSAQRVLFRQGQPPSRLFLLKAGEVVLTSRLADKCVLGFRAAPGSLIGLPAVAANQPYSMTATVTKNSDVHAITVSTFREIVGSNPRLSFRVLEILAGEVRSARHLASTALSTVASQVTLTG